MKKITFTLMIICLTGLLSQQLHAQFLLPETKNIPVDQPVLVEYQKAFNEWAAGHDLNQEKGWKWFARWMEFNAQRADKNGALPDLSPSLQASVQVSKQKSMYKSEQSGWSPVGPTVLPPSPNSSSGHGMARINCITFHPTDPDTYWIGIAQGGVWKTTDHGASYTPLTDDLPILRISDIALDPNNTDVIYISVCDYAYIGAGLDTDSRKRHTHYGLGVYKTTDGGLSWNPTGLGFNQTDRDATLIRRVLVDPEDSNRLLAAGVSGIYTSDNAGDTWDQVHENLIWDIEQDYSNGHTIYATSGHNPRLQLGSTGFMKSVDFGRTWTDIESPMSDNADISRIEIGISRSDPNYIYTIACDFSGGFYAFYRSIDGGETFTKRSDHNNAPNVLHWYQGQGSGGQGMYDLSILVDPNDKNKIFVGGINMWGSDDGGVSWDGCTYWVFYYGKSVHADQHQYQYNPVDQYYYVCHDGGLSRTQDIQIGSWDDAQNQNNYKFPTNWEDVSSGMAVTSFYRLGICESRPDFIIAGAQDNSTFFKKGDEWLNIIGGDGMECLIHPDNPNIIFGSTQYGNLVSSTNGGQNISYGVSNQMRSSEKGGWTTPIIMDRNNPTDLLTGFGNVWKTSNRGGSWTKISNFGNVPGYGYPSIISALAPQAHNFENIYIAKRMYFEYDAPSTVWRKLESDDRWVDITAGLPEWLYFTYIAVDDADSTNVWVSCSGFSEGEKVFHSNDGGTTWDNISYNLPNIPVNTIVHDDASNNHRVYIGTDVGVYYTQDGLEEWVLYSDLLPNVIVSELEIHQPTRKLYAATFGRAIWQTDLIEPATAVHDMSLNSLDLNLYPSPNNGNFEIEIESLSVGKAQIEIIDVMGAKIYEKEIQLSSNHFSLSISENLKPGMYFMRANQGLQSKTVRFIVK